MTRRSGQGWTLIERWCERYPNDWRLLFERPDGMQLEVAVPEDVWRSFDGVQLKMKRHQFPRPEMQEIGKPPSAAAQVHLTFKENVVMRLIGFVLLIAPHAGVRFMASVTEGVMQKMGEAEHASV